MLFNSAKLTSFTRPILWLPSPQYTINFITPTRQCVTATGRKHTVWQVIFGGHNFRGKSEKALRINFRRFKFRDSNQSRGVALHKR